MNPYQQYMYSYPHKTAYGALFGVSLADYAERLAGSRTSLYFHIPFCQSKCGYCNLFSVVGQGYDVMEQYIDAMERHAGQISRILPDSVEFSDLTLGGGTPLVLSVPQLERVFRIAGQLGFRMEGRQVVVETSPAQTTEEKLELLKEHGATRISMGVQSFFQEELARLNRNHTVEQVRGAVGLIRRAGVPGMDLDVVDGRPGGVEESLLSSVKQALSYDPEELFLYPLYIKKDTFLSSQSVMRQEDAFHMYGAARKYLIEKGYVPYSMRRFVRGGDAGGLTGCGFENTLSIGCGGRTYIDELHFCMPYGVRQSQCRQILMSYMEEEDYLSVRHGYLLSEEERRRRYVIKNILFASGLSLGHYRECFKTDPRQEFPVLTEWIRQGYAQSDGEWIRLTEDGFCLSDYLGPMLISDEVREKMLHSEISPMLEG